MKDVSGELFKKFAVMYEEVNMSPVSKDTKFSPMEREILRRYVQGKETEESVKSLLAKCAILNGRIGMAQCERFTN